MFAIEHKKVCGIFLSWDLFFYPRRVCSTVFTQQQHQQRNVYKKLDTLRALFYVTFNNFNDFFHGNSLLIKMQTLKMKTHSFCVLFILSIDFILFLICKKEKKTSFCSFHLWRCYWRQFHHYCVFTCTFEQVFYGHHEGASGIKCAKKRQVL